MKKSWLVILVTILSVVFILGVTYLICDKVLNNDKEIVDNETDDNKEEDINKEEDNKQDVNNDKDGEFSLEDLKGVWMNCGLNELNNKICYFISVEESNDNYAFVMGQYQTGGGIVSKVTSLTNIRDDYYQLELYSEEVNGPIVFRPAITTILTIDTNDDNIIIYNAAGFKYEYVAKDLSSNLLEKYYNDYIASKTIYEKVAGTYEYDEKIPGSSYNKLKLFEDGNYRYEEGRYNGDGWIAKGKFKVENNKIYLTNDNCKEQLIDGEYITVNCNKTFEFDYIEQENNIIIKNSYFTFEKIN